MTFAMSIEGWLLTVLWYDGRLQVTLRRNDKLLSQLLQLILRVQLDRVLQGGIDLPSSDFFNESHLQIFFMLGYCNGYFNGYNVVLSLNRFNGSVVREYVPLNDTLSSPCVVRWRGRRANRRLIAAQAPPVRSHFGGPNITSCNVCRALRTLRRSLHDCGVSPLFYPFRPSLLILKCCIPHLRHFDALKRAKR